MRGEELPHRHPAERSHHTAGQVAEVAAGNRDDYLRSAKLPHRVDIVQHLRKKTADVDRVGRRELYTVVPRVGESFLHEPLAIVEVTSDGHGLNTLPLDDELSLLRRTHQDRKSVV